MVLRSYNKIPNNDRHDWKPHGLEDFVISWLVGLPFLSLSVLTIMVISIFGIIGVI